MKHNNRTICIIDDDKIYQSLTKRLLMKFYPDVNVLQFFDGADAIEYIDYTIKNNEELPNVILLDINMPMMDGWEFLEALERLNPNFAKMNIHVVSSSIAVQDMEKARSNTHIIDYITKPIQSEILKSLI